MHWPQFDNGLGLLFSNVLKGHSWIKGGSQMPAIEGLQLKAALTIMQQAYWCICVSLVEIKMLVAGALTIEYDNGLGLLFSKVLEGHSWIDLSTYPPPPPPPSPSPPSSSQSYIFRVCKVIHPIIHEHLYTPENMKQVDCAITNVVVECAIEICLNRKNMLAFIWYVHWSEQSHLPGENKTLHVLDSYQL